MVPLTIRMFLGQTEIKVDTVFEGETKRQSFYFNASSEDERKRIESCHAKNHISVPAPAPISTPVDISARKLKPE